MSIAIYIGLAIFLRFGNYQEVQYTLQRLQQNTR